jgi:hypothetical protein
MHRGAATRTVTGGIDTHGEVHVAAVLNEVGGLLGTQPLVSAHGVALV